MTSTANRTSPVQRGKYVMEVLLGTAPPPPANRANVPALPETAEKAGPGHVAKPLVGPGAPGRASQESEPCAGFPPLQTDGPDRDSSLENYDVLEEACGGPTTADSRIDASGNRRCSTAERSLTGRPACGEALLSHSDLFLGNVRGKSSGVWRSAACPVEPSDMPVVRSVVKDAGRNNGNRFSALVLAIVKSAPFQMRRAGRKRTRGQYRCGDRRT